MTSPPKVARPLAAPEAVKHRKAVADHGADAGQHPCGAEPGEQVLRQLAGEEGLHQVKKHDENPRAPAENQHGVGGTKVSGAGFAHVGLLHPAHQRGWAERTDKISQSNAENCVHKNLTFENGLKRRLLDLCVAAGVLLRRGGDLPQDDDRVGRPVDGKFLYRFQL